MRLLCLQLIIYTEKKPVDRFIRRIIPDIPDCFLTFQNRDVSSGTIGVLIYPTVSVRLNRYNCYGNAILFFRKFETGLYQYTAR